MHQWSRPRPRRATCEQPAAAAAVAFDSAVDGHNGGRGGRRGRRTGAAEGERLRGPESGRAASAAQSRAARVARAPAAARAGGEAAVVRGSSYLCPWRGGGVFGGCDAMRPPQPPRPPRGLQPSATDDLPRVAGRVGMMKKPARASSVPITRVVAERTRTSPDAPPRCAGGLRDSSPPNTRRATHVGRLGVERLAESARRCSSGSCRRAAYGATADQMRLELVRGLDVSEAEVDVPDALSWRSGDSLPMMSSTSDEADVDEGKETMPEWSGSSGRDALAREVDRDGAEDDQHVGARVVLAVARRVERRRDQMRLELAPMW